MEILALTLTTAYGDLFIPVQKTGGDGFRIALQAVFDADDAVLTAAEAYADAIGSAASAALSAHVSASNPHTQYEQTTNKGAANGYCPLDSGTKIPSSYLPALAISEYLGSVASQAAMLALTGQRGDFCVRSDLGDEFILIADDPTTLANWLQIVKPFSAVTSVAGRTGPITLSAADISGLGDATGAAGAFAFSGVITPTTLAASTDDWAPTGLASAAMIRASASAAYNLTGLTGGASGRVVFLHNAGSYTITLKDESGSSTAANRFALASDTDLAPDSILILQYDATSARWRTAGGGVPTDFGQKAIFNFVATERTITGATTAAATDNGTWINADKSTDFTLTIDASVSLPAGFNFAVYQVAAGRLTIAGTGGATIVNRQSATKTTGIYAVATVKRIGSTNTYVLSGDVA